MSVVELSRDPVTGALRAAPKLEVRGVTKLYARDGKTLPVLENF